LKAKPAFEEDASRNGNGAAMADWSPLQSYFEGMPSTARMENMLDCLIQCSPSGVRYESLAVGVLPDRPTAFVLSWPT
jgi:hypothetical protein